MSIDQWCVGGVNVYLADKRSTASPFLASALSTRIESVLWQVNMRTGCYSIGSPYNHQAPKPACRPHPPRWFSVVPPSRLRELGSSDEPIRPRRSRRDGSMQLCFYGTANKPGNKFPHRRIPVSLIVGRRDICRQFTTHYELH
jgi:hypothetical protein